MISFPQFHRGRGRWQQRVNAALTQIPAHSPEWTDFNSSDPGVTLVQLFVWSLQDLLTQRDTTPQRDRVLLQWIAARLRKRRRTPRALVLGPDKKSRTAPAQFLANKLGRELYRVDLSAVASKYIGETEKNLRRLFTAAERKDAILFLDEADALFGKRTRVKDSKDRYANLDTNRLLQRLEKFKGILILAGRRRENFSATFWQRLGGMAIDTTAAPRPSPQRQPTPDEPQPMPPNPQSPGVHIEATPGGIKTIAGVPTHITAIIGQSGRGPWHQPVEIGSATGFENIFGAPAPNYELGYAVRQFFLNGGEKAWVVRVPDGATDSDWNTAITALDTVDINLLVLPGMTAPTVVRTAVDYCEQRRAFLIVDLPEAVVTPDQVQQHVASGALPRSKNAAVFYPWVEIANSGAPRWSPPSATMAGVMARQDAARGVWKAAAGAEATLKGVSNLKYLLKEAEGSRLNSQAINCLRSLPGSGFVAWGARTLFGTTAPDPEWKYIPVRRLVLFLEESLYRGTKWVGFEPNDESLWARLRSMVGSFLQSLWQQGALEGRASREAYFVRCDQGTMTQNDIERGMVNIMIGIAPFQPAEFVILKIQLWTEV